VSEPPISCWTAGSATFTIVTSSWMTKNPRQIEISPMTCPRLTFAGDRLNLLGK
jgi:hypothetical protein